MRFMTFILLLFHMINPIHAQMTYGDRRAQADMDPKTVSARRHFTAMMNEAFESKTSDLKLTDLTLKLNDRLIAQYGRGKASAFKVLPQELDQILELIHAAKYERESLIHDVLRFHHVNEAQLRKAISKLATTKVIELSYWGYLSKQEYLPTYNASRRTLSYFARWHEAKSYYEKYPQRQMRKNILLSLLATQDQKSWLETIFQ